MSTATALSYVDAKRTDEEIIALAEKQLKKENRQAEIIQATVDALKTNPNEKGAKALEKSVEGVLDWMGVHSGKQLEREIEKKYDARRPGEIIVEREKKNAAGSDSRGQPEKAGNGAGTSERSSRSRTNSSSGDAAAISVPLNR